MMSDEQQAMVPAYTLEQGRQLLESLRRETPSALFAPKSFTNPETGAMIDYAAPGLLIDLGKSHLDESLPNGQYLRSLHAINLMAQGIRETIEWFNAMQAHIEASAKKPE